MKAAVVGLGYWGPNLVRNLHANELCDEIVVCDVDAEKVARITSDYPSIKGTSDWDRVLSDPDVAAVLIATPVQTHAQLAEEALLAGKSALVEKPLAASLKEGRALVDLATERGLLIMAAHTFLHSPPVTHVKGLIESGAVGEVLQVHSSRVNLGMRQPNVSVIWDLAPHDLSILTWWLGELPAWVSAVGRAGERPEPLDLAFVSLGFPSGCIANLHLAWLDQSWPDRTKLRTMSVIGRKQMIVYDDLNEAEPVKVWEKGARTPTIPIVIGEPLLDQIGVFLKRVQAGETPDRREEVALAILDTIECAERSVLEQGAVVYL